MRTYNYITDYRIAPVNEVQKLLMEGFQPYGSPFIFQNYHKEKETTCYQALVKSSSVASCISEKTVHDNPLHLNSIEKQCIAGLINDLDYNDIAKKIHRSPRTVRNIIGQLRKKCNCQTNVGLALALQPYFPY